MRSGRQIEQTLRLDAAPGAKVSPGTAVAALADPTRLELTVQVAEVDIPGIESGRTVDVLIDAFPDQTFAGVISRIEPFTETQNGVISYPVTIQLLDNAQDSVLPGMTAVAALRSEAAGDRWPVPSTAIREVDGATVVTVVRGQERLPLAVTPEGLHGEWTIVRSAGLQDGNEVADATRLLRRRIGRRCNLSLWNGGFAGLMERLMMTTRKNISCQTPPGKAIFQDICLCR